MTLVPQPLMRALRARVAIVLHEVPLFFFAVVIGVAVVFKVAVGWATATTETPLSPREEALAAAAASPSASASAGTPAGTDRFGLAADPAAGAGAAPTSAPRTATPTIRGRAVQRRKGPR